MEMYPYPRWPSKWPLSDGEYFILGKGNHTERGKQDKKTIVSITHPEADAIDEVHALERIVPSLARVIDSDVVPSVRLINIDVSLQYSRRLEFGRGGPDGPFPPCSTSVGQSEHRTLEVRSMMRCRQRYPCASDS
jgi:hypothetical protein